MAVDEGGALIGGVLAGRYELGRRLGRGGTAIVFDAWDRAQGRRVAVKVLDALFSSTGLRKRFLGEAASASGLSHPGLVSVLDAGEHDGLPFLVMEYVHGRTLADLLAGAAPLAPAVAVSVVGEAAEALGALHAHGLVHRDVKPANIMVTTDGRTRVMDFGIARALGEAAALTLTTGVLGTPHYMSPEQITSRPPDARSDLYSLGVVLYECLTGRPPFDGATAMAVAVQHVRVVPGPLRELRPELPAGLESVTLQALRKDPEERWQTAAAFRQALDQALRPADTVRLPARPPAPTRPSQPFNPQTARLDRVRVAARGPARGASVPRAAIPPREEAGWDLTWLRARPGLRHIPEDDLRRWLRTALTAVGIVALAIAGFVGGTALPID